MMSFSGAELPRAGNLDLAYLVFRAKAVAEIYLGNPFLG